MPAAAGEARLAGMLIAADNLSAARPSVRRAIQARDGGAIAGLCRRCARAGAAWLDINPGFLRPGDRREVWRFLIDTAEQACDLTLMIDAPDPASLELAVGLCSRPPVLNMATAEPQRLGPVLDIAAGHGLTLVAATMTAAVPLTSDERLSLAALIAAEATQRGIEGGRLLLDPMVMPLALPDGERHARAVIETLRALPQLFTPPPRSLIALSNLTTRTAGRDAGFTAGPFLAAAWGAGLSVALLDALDPALMRVAGLCQVFGAKRVFAPGEFQP